MNANRKAALALAAWLAVLPGFTVAEAYTEETQTVENQEEPEVQEEPVEEDAQVQNEEPEEPVQTEEPEQPDMPDEQQEVQTEEPEKPVQEEETEQPEVQEEQPETPAEQPEETTGEPENTETPAAEEPETAEDTPRPEETPVQTDTPAAEKTPAPEQTEAPAPQDAAATLLLEETQRPVVVDMPEDDWKPWGEAWTELDDGNKTAGALSEVLTWLESRLDEDESATVLIRTSDEISAEDVSQRLLDRVSFDADGDVFNVDEHEYEVLVDSDDVTTLELTDEENDDVRLSIRVQVLRKDAPVNPNPTTAPDETNKPSETAKPSEMTEPGGTTEPGETNEPAETTQPGGTADPNATPTPTPSPTIEPTATPKVPFEVTAENYNPGVWTSEIPVFTLSGIPEGSTEYVYGVFICDEKLVLLSNGNNVYMPTDEGLTSVRFAVLDKMGDVQALSDQYDMMLDLSAPDGPYLSGDDECKTVCYVTADDWLSGVEAISFDEGETWEPYIGSEQEMSFLGEVGDTVEAGTIWVRDAAGNIAVNEEEFTFGKKPRTGTGTGTGKKPIRHVKETMDYSKANYNALELNVSDAPQTELTIGGTALNLSLTSEGQTEAFTAELTTWQTAAGDELTAPNALVLTAANAAQTNVWHFGGEAYKLLSNSGVDYLVFASGDYITVIPTTGFTGGTQYGKLKAGGVSTRKFEYTLIQDEALRETTLSVQVEGETYLLEENTESPMYRYDVLVGTKNMMKKPYESYKPSKEAI